MPSYVKSGDMEMLRMVTYDGVWVSFGDLVAWKRDISGGRETTKAELRYYAQLVVDQYAIQLTEFLEDYMVCDGYQDIVFGLESRMLLLNENGVERFLNYSRLNSVTDSEAAALKDICDLALSSGSSIPFI